MNTPGTFAKGTRLWVHDRAATVLDATDPRAAQIAYDGAEAPETADLLALYAAEALRWEPPASAPAPVPAELVQIPETAWNEARRREELLRVVLDAADIEKAVRETCVSAKVSRETMYRWKGDYLRDGLRGLVPNTAARGGKGQKRLDKGRETLLDELIHHLNSFVLGSGADAPDFRPGRKRPRGRTRRSGFETTPTILMYRGQRMSTRPLHASRGSVGSAS